VRAQACLLPLRFAEERAEEPTEAATGTSDYVRKSVLTASLHPPSPQRTPGKADFNPAYGRPPAAAPRVQTIV